jgi:hypothetical protein
LLKSYVTIPVDRGCRGVQRRAVLSASDGWFAEGFDTPVLKEAKALLDEL